MCPLLVWIASFTPLTRLSPLTDVIKLRISVLVCNLDKKFLGLHIFIGYTHTQQLSPFAGLNMLLTIMEWKCWGKYDGSCHLHRVKWESRRLGQMKKGWPEVLHFISINSTILEKYTAHLESLKMKNQTETRVKTSQKIHWFFCSKAAEDNNKKPASPHPSQSLNWPGHCLLLRCSGIYLLTVQQGRNFLWRSTYES